jgi:hypothetical protein
MKHKLTQEQRIKQLEDLAEDLLYRTSDLSKRVTHLQLIEHSRNKGTQNSE